MGTPPPAMPLLTLGTAPYKHDKRCLAHYLAPARCASSGKYLVLSESAPSSFSKCRWYLLLGVMPVEISGSVWHVYAFIHVSFLSTVRITQGTSQNHGVPDSGPEDLGPRAWTGAGPLGFNTLLSSREACRLRRRRTRAHRCRTSQMPGNGGMFQSLLV